ncbi:MAG: ribosomal L7Ae/L30e/S12e/Gadd45 family protein [Acholeplasmataceae bacterium]|nr:ribosomal L7Ae/L30e/S12e/Gadd45 family protein [Acholeplasmataceae bacterium]
MDKTIGLAYRARKITIGTEMTIEKLRKKELYAIILASDASKLTQKKVRDKAKTYETPVLDTLDSLTLSNAIGKTDIKVIGITDKGFSQLLIDQKRK